MIAVTGSSGFIGKYLVNNTDKAVKAIVRKKSSYEIDCCSVLEADLNDPFLYKVFEKIDVVVHLAGLAHREFTLNDFENNLISFKNVIYSASKENVKRIVYVSSVSMFEGHNAKISKDSIPSPATISSNYKLKSELLLKDLSKSLKIEFVIIRSPLVYGEGVKANFASLMRLVGKGLPLPFRAINKNKRSLVSLYNLVDLIEVCIDHPKAVNQVFLVSDDNDLSTSQMVTLMAKVQGKANLSIPVPLWCFKLVGKVFKKDAVVNRLVGSLQLDIEHTKNTLDWVPPYTVEHGFELAAKNKG